MDDERALAEQAAGGDERAFELIVHRHTDAVWRVARALLPDDGSAEEAVQDTFLRAYRGLAAFRGEAELRTWLLAICHRACVDRLRAARLPRAPVRLEELAGAGDDERDSDIRSALRGALSRLDEVEREAFLLVDVLGHSREEAARICGVPASTMRSRVARARGELVKLLDDRSAEAVVRCW